MRNPPNTGPSQFNSGGDFMSYLQSMWGGQPEQQAQSAQPWINPDTGIPAGGFAGASGVAEPWQNPDKPDAIKQQMLAKLLMQNNKPQPAAQAAPSLAPSAQTSIIPGAESVPGAFGGQSRMAEPQPRMSNMRGKMRPMGMGGYNG